MGSFQLVGHDNCFVRYPAPVVTVLRRGGKLFNAVAEKGNPNARTTVEVDAKSQFVPLTDHDQKALSNFDYRTEALFAFSPDNLWRYKIKDQRKVFLALLNDPRLKADPAMSQVLIRIIRGL